MFDSLSDRITAALRRLGNKGVVSAADVEAALREVRIALLEADVNFKVVKQFAERVRERATGSEVLSSLEPSQMVVKVVHDELVALLGGDGGATTIRYSPRPPTVIMLVGLQGAGKTTTAAKLALMTRRDGHRPLLVGLDLKRPAAVAQLRTLAERDGFGFHSGSGSVTEIAEAAISEARRLNLDVVVLDTAGRLQANEELMAEIGALKSAVGPHETLLVADAMTGQAAVDVGVEFDRAVGLDGIILTKLDGDTRGGAALSIRVATGHPVRFIGVGEKPGDLELFHPDRMASRILGMGDVMTLIEKAQAVVSTEQAVEQEKRMRQGKLTFDDMLNQFRQLRSLGSLESVMGMLPGMASLKGQVAGPEAEQEMRRMEAIILSMTVRERGRPELIDGSRRRRIARGSGTQVSDVNRLLKSREAMQQMFKQMMGGRGKGGLNLARLGIRPR